MYGARWFTWLINPGSLQTGWFNGNASKDLKSACAGRMIGNVVDQANMFSEITVAFTLNKFRTWICADHVDKSTLFLASRSKQVVTTRPSPSNHVIWTRRRSRSFPPCFYAFTCVASGDACMLKAIFCHLPQRLGVRERATLVKTSQHIPKAVYSYWQTDSQISTT